MNLPPLLLALTLCWAAPALAQTPAAVPIWPAGQRPGSATTEAETLHDGHVTNVSVPTITVYPAPAAPGVGPTPAVIVCPGGAYHGLSITKEGTEPAAWLNSIGVTAVVLKYRVPNERDGALADLQRTVRLMRQRAAQWHIDPAKVGVLGFSAGGHLCARLAANPGAGSYPAIDAADAQSFQPAFVLLAYPAYLGRPDGAVPSELPVTSANPPTFVLQAEDDHTYVGGTKVYVAALERVKAPYETFFGAKGGHGFGLPTHGEMSAWPARAADWLRRLGVLTSTPTKP